MNFGNFLSCFEIPNVTNVEEYGLQVSFQQLRSIWFLVFEFLESWTTKVSQRSSVNIFNFVSRTFYNKESVKLTYKDKDGHFKLYRIGDHELLIIRDLSVFNFDGYVFYYTRFFFLQFSREETYQLRCKDTIVKSRDLTLQKEIKRILLSQSCITLNHRLQFFTCH